MMNQDVRYNLLAVVPDRRVALTKRMQMLRRNRQLIQDILFRMCQFDHTSKSLHCSNSYNSTVTNTTTTTNAAPINHHHSHNQFNGHRHLHSHIQEKHKSSHSEHFSVNDVCVHPLSSSSVPMDHDSPSVEKCSPTDTSIHSCTNSNSSNNNPDKDKYEAPDDIENSRSIKTRSATRAAKQTNYANNCHESESNKSIHQKQNNNSLSDTTSTVTGSILSTNDYNTCFSTRKRSSYSSSHERDDDPDYWCCDHKKPYLHISHHDIANENGYKCDSQLEHSPSENKINRIFASFISNDSPLPLTVFTETGSSTTNRLNANKPYHSIEDCSDSKGNLQEVQNLENGIPNGTSLKIEENCLNETKDFHLLGRNSNQFTKVIPASTSCTELNSVKIHEPIFCSQSTFLGKQDIPPKELTKPLTVETKLWCDSVENVDTGDSETPVTGDIYPTNSSITSSTELCGAVVIDSRPQTRALTRASLKQNSLSSTQASTEERISTCKIPSDNVQLSKSVLMNHESNLYNSNVLSKHRSSTELSPMTTEFLIESNISISSTDVLSLHRGSKYSTRSSTRMDTLASHNLANLRSNSITLQGNASPSKVSKIVSSSERSSTDASNIINNTATISSTYLSPFTYDYIKSRNSPSLYPPPLSLEELNILLHKIDEQIKLCSNALIEEGEKRRSYRIDDARRIHNYEPFIRAFLTALARHGMLRDQILSAMKVKNTPVTTQNHVASTKVSDNFKKSSVKNYNDSGKHVSHKVTSEHIYSSFTNSSSIKNRTFLSNSLINRLTRVSQSIKNNIRASHHYRSLNYRKLRRRKIKDSIRNSRSDHTENDIALVESKSSLTAKPDDVISSCEQSVTTGSLSFINSTVSCSLHNALTNSKVTRQTSAVSKQGKNLRAIQINANQQCTDETNESTSQGPLVISNGLCSDNCQKSSVTIDENTIVEGNLLSTVSSVTLASCSSCGSSPQSSNSSRSTNLRSSSSGVKLRQIKSDDRINTRRSLRPRASREHVFAHEANNSADSVSVTSEDPDTNNSNGINLRDRPIKSSSRVNNIDSTNCTVIDTSTSSNSQRFRKRRL
ncbi:Ubiquitin carboxyl-terminal hydrolase BAP1 [Schistosoma japonicum]|nr:Ubiquitin carboxyl-terminal hydrolase BAP1 [Schistosoma japonicum]